MPVDHFEVFNNQKNYTNQDNMSRYHNQNLGSIWK